MKISLVIAIQDDGEIFIDLLNKLENQERLPDELIIMDSSSNKKFSNQVQRRLSNFIIQNKYEKIDKCFQGKGLNEGIKKSSGDLICFLDTKTIPTNKWIKDYEEKIINNELEVIWGSTKFKNKSFFQGLYKATTYGNIIHKTVPGSMVRKKIFLNKTFYFNENLRSSFDLEWKEKIVNNFKTLDPKSNYLTYSHLPKNIFDIIIRHSIYGFYTALGNSQNNLKDFYLSVFLIFSALIIPKWNYLFEGWDKNPLYIPNITKIYLLCIIIIGLIYFFLKKIKILKKLIFFEFYIKLGIFIFVSVGVYRWNASVAQWIEQSVFYIPHITKIYVLNIAIIIIFYRGIIRPIQRKEHIGFLLPINWFFIGSIGLLIELIKMPFFIFGSVYTNCMIIIKKIKT